MRGLLYKDFQLILNKLSVKSRLLIILVLLLVTIFGRESGTIFLSIMGPISLASMPTGLLIADQESGWNRFVGVFPIPKRNIVLARYIFLYFFYCIYQLYNFNFKHCHCSNFPTIQPANSYIDSDSWLIDWYHVCSTLTPSSLCFRYVWKHNCEYTGFSPYYGRGLYFAENDLGSIVHRLDW